MKPEEANQIYPKDPSEWREWLGRNHDKQNSVWLLFYKKSSPLANLSWSQAVDEALCFGWIDGRKQSIDEASYRQYFSKRKPGSTWSKINKEKILKLLAEGLMREAGLTAVKDAKADGSWTLLDAVDALILPVDLEQALKNKTGAFEYYNALSASKKKMILYWVFSAKKEETRRKRIEKTALCCTESRMPVA